MTRLRALKLVAADAAATAIEKSLGDWGVVSWEDYPELGESDWDYVVKLGEAIGENLRPHQQDLAEARDLLAVADEVEA